MKTYEVRILGQRYKIRSDEGEEYIHGLAQYVNDQIAEVQRSSKTVATHNVTILAALNIADRYLKLRDRDARLRQEVQDRVRRAMKLIRAGESAEGKP
ncbi:MAG TPA: cell division protein ZapA [Myxococcota bacterium]|nr:cell division protein ZapA [Myxococcota bacterium]HRY96533.1 cell division protein ZapA [Myxococcota bacterium]HSA23230.1 cell division protein ZapA [Myxococcota bacterium]